MRDSRATHQIGWGSGGAELGRGGGSRSCGLLCSFILHPTVGTSYITQPQCTAVLLPRSSLTGSHCQNNNKLAVGSHFPRRISWVLLDRSAVVFTSNSIRRGAAGQQEGGCLGASRGPDSKPDECIFLLGFIRAPPRKCYI